MEITRKRISKKWTFILAAIMTVFFLTIAAMETSAAPAAPANLKQTSAFGTYAKIRWDAVAGTGVKYLVEVSQDQKTWAPLQTVGNTYYTIAKMQAGANYYIRVTAIVGTAKSPATAPLQVIPQPGYISEVKQTASKKNSVTVSWSASAGAGAYDVYVGTSDENMKYYQTVSKGTKVTIKKLKANKNYIVKVLPFQISQSGFRTNGFEKANTAVRTIPGKVSGLTVSSWSYGSANITVEWNQKENVDGYQVKFYNAANKCVKTINTTNETATFKKATANTCYKVQVRGYITVNGKKKYSAYSNAVYAISQAQMTAFTQHPGKLTIGWNPVEGATSYSVYVTTTNPNYPGAYAKIADVDKGVTTYTTSKYGTAAITAEENYYAYVVANKKVGSKTYTSKVTQAWYCNNN